MTASKTDDKISVRYYTNMQNETELNSVMFTEDFYKNIVPTYGSLQKNVQCTLEPEDEDIRELLVEFFPSYRHRYNDDFNEIILAAILFIANYLVHHGYLVLELVTYSDYNDNKYYSLENIYGADVKIENDFILQTVHEDAAGQLKIKEPIKIPKDKCFVIDFPNVLGGKKKYLEFLSDFKELGKQTPMLRYFNNPLNGKPGYDLSEHQKLHDLELWKKSKMFNWHHRGGYEKYFSGYYSIYRHLMFKKSQIVLRDYIIENLKKIITVFSEKIGTKTELKIEGLITLEKVDEKISEWKSGQLKPNSINEVL